MNTAKIYVESGVIIAELSRDGIVFAAISFGKEDKVDRREMKGKLGEMGYDVMEGINDNVR